MTGVAGADLPELPEPALFAPQMITEDAYTADQMRAYVESDRARRQGALTEAVNELGELRWAPFFPDDTDDAKGLRAEVRRLRAAIKNSHERFCAALSLKGAGD